MPTAKRTENQYAKAILERGAYARSLSNTVEGIANAEFPGGRENESWRSMFRVAMAQVHDYPTSVRKGRVYRHSDQFEDLIAARSFRAVLEIERCGDYDDHDLLQWVDWHETYQDTVLDKEVGHA